MIKQSIFIPLPPPTAKDFDSLESTHACVSLSHMFENSFAPLVNLFEKWVNARSTQKFTL